VSIYPGLESVRLADYKVRVVSPEDGTAAFVRVLVEHTNGEATWNTVGVSMNILEASWQAIADGVRYHLMRTGALPPVHATAEGDGISTSDKAVRAVTLA
jgi:2-isopropylmalate synthase